MTDAVFSSIEDELKHPSTSSTENHKRNATYATTQRRFKKATVRDVCYDSSDSEDTKSDEESSEADPEINVDYLEHEETKHERYDNMH
jgi:hypothetical protein